MHLQKNTRFETLYYPFTTEICFVNGREISYYDSKTPSNKILLFIHGLGSNLCAWEWQLLALRDKYRCIALDLPGYGKSDKFGKALGMKEFAEFLKDFLAQLGMAKVCLVGHSMGGQIAMTFALNYPTLVNALFLVAPAGIERFSSADKEWFSLIFNEMTLRQLHPAQIRINMERNFFFLDAKAQKLVEDRLGIMQDPEYPHFCRALAFSVKAMLDEPVFAQLHSLEMPLFLVAGENDHYIPNKILHPMMETKAVFQSLREQKADAQLAFLPDCGHFAMYDKKDEISQLLEAFLLKNI